MIRRILASIGLSIVSVIGLSGATGTLMPAPYQTLLDTNGNPVVNGKVCTYVAGTTTPATTYSDAVLSVPNANPIRTDSAGRFVAYLVTGSSYKFVYQDATGTAGTCDGVVLKTVDNVSAIPSASGNVDLTGIAGEAITAGQCVYLSDGSGSKTAGQWFKCDAANGYSSVLPFVGMAPSAIGSGVSGTIRIGGSITGLSSLSVGSDYFVGTAGAITSTAPANRRYLGRADTSASLALQADPSLLAHTGTPSNGQLLIGNGAGFTLATPTGTGITVTGGAGTLALSANARVLDKVTTEQDVTNTSTETSIYSFSVPGGTLSTGNAIRITLTGMMHVDTASDTLTLRVKWGGSTILSSSGYSLTATDDVGYRAVIEIVANNATNSQRATYVMQRGGGATNATSGVIALGQQGLDVGYNNTLAVDSTAAQTVQVTIQWAGTNATDHFRRWLGTTEVIQ